MLGAVLGGDLRERALVAVALFAAALIGSLVLVRAAGAIAPRLLFAGLVALRLLALVGHPSLSDDWYRYVHEGRAQRLGLAVPYATPPAAVTPPPDDGITARVNHKEVPAAYPPGVELILWGTVAAGDVVGRPLLPLRLLLVAADILVLWLLYRRRGQAPRAFAIYGAHPLPLLETALGAHLDGLGATAILVAVLSSRPALQGALIGLAAHVKPVAAVALVGVRRAALPMVLVGFAAAVLLPAVPYLVAGAPLHKGLLEYSTRWRAAPFVYAALEAALRPTFDARALEDRYAHVHIRADGLLLEEAGRPLIAVGAAKTAERPILLDAGFFARVLAGAILAAVLVLIARSRSSPERRVGMALAAVWLLAPTVHPWYLTWIVPFAALSSSRALWAFSAASPLLYQPLFGPLVGPLLGPTPPTGGGQEAAWPRVLVVAALVVGAVLDARATRRGDGS